MQFKMSDEDEYRCFVGGLAWSTSDRKLKDTFEKFGKLTEAKVINIKLMSLSYLMIVRRNWFMLHSRLASRQEILSLFIFMLGENFQYLPNLFIRKPCKQDKKKSM